MRLLTLDLSTTCSGWALFCVESRELLDHGIIKPVNKGLSKLTYPEKQLKKMRTIIVQLIELIVKYNDIGLIVVEEVNLHKSRLTGKTLDGFHYLFIDRLDDDTLKKLMFIDSDGNKGWRTLLKLRMSDADRLANRERKKLNGKIAKGTKKIPLINKKHLACRFVNVYYGTAFNVDENQYDNDIVDAIGIGHAVLHYWRIDGGE